MAFHLRLRQQGAFQSISFPSQQLQIKVNFKHISRLVLVFLLLTLSNKCRLGIMTLTFRSSWLQESFSIHLHLALKGKNPLWSLTLLLLPCSRQYLQKLQAVRMVFLLSTILLYSTHSMLDVFASGNLRSSNLEEEYCWRYFSSVTSTYRPHFHQ